FFVPLNRSYKDTKSIDNSVVRTVKGVRVIPVMLHIEYDNFSDFERVKENIAEWLVYNEPKKLEFTREPDRFYFALVSGSVEYDDPLPTAVDATINFICGYKYSQERNFTINNTSTRTIAGHESTSWRTKTVFSSNVTGYELQFNAPGKTALRDINKIVVKGNFISECSIESDYAKSRRMINGKDISNQLGIMQTKYAELPVGNVKFEVSYKTEVFYHDKYY